MHTYLHIYRHTLIYTFHIHAYTRLHRKENKHIYMHTYIHISHTHTHVHTHSHIYKHAQPQKQCTFLDGYCSTVQGLLDWFEVDLGFTELSFIPIGLCVLCVPQKQCKTHTHTYTYAHTHTHTHTHTHAHSYIMGTIKSDETALVVQFGEQTVFVRARDAVSHGQKPLVHERRDEIYICNTHIHIYV